MQRIRIHLIHVLFVWILKLRTLPKRGYKIEFTAPRDKHAGGIAERMVGLVTSKTNSAMLDNGVPPAYWNWAMFKATQDLNFNYNAKIKTSPYNFVTGQHIDIKYLHSFFAECYMFIPLSEREGKLVVLKDAVSLPTSTLITT